MCRLEGLVEAGMAGAAGLAGNASWEQAHEQAQGAGQSRQQSIGSRLGNDSHSLPYSLCLGVM